MRERERPRPYNRLTEAMSEVALELNHARALVQSLEIQYQMLSMEYSKQKPPSAFPKVSKK